MTIDLQNIKKLFVGNQELKKLYKGNQLIWQSGIFINQQAYSLKSDDSGNIFVLSAKDNICYLSMINSNGDIVYNYRTGWNLPIEMVKVGEEIYFSNGYKCNSLNPSGPVANGMKAGTKIDYFNNTFIVYSDNKFYEYQSNSLKDSIESLGVKKMKLSHFNDNTTRITILSNTKIFIRKKFATGTWVELSPYTINAIVFDGDITSKSDTSLFYLLTKNNSLVKLKDGKKIWETALDENIQNEFVDVKVKGDKIFAITSTNFYVFDEASGNQIFKTDEISTPALNQYNDLIIVNNDGTCDIAVTDSNTSEIKKIEWKG